MVIKKVKSDTDTQVSKKSDYCKAQEHIRCAIDELGKTAKDDVVAKESIANLSVVLMDLM